MSFCPKCGTETVRVKKYCSANTKDGVLNVQWTRPMRNTIKSTPKNDPRGIR